MITEQDKKSKLAMFARWLEDGESFIAVFQNQDLGHSDMGRRVAMCFDDSSWDGAEIGKAAAPDHKAIGFGWRYMLIIKTRNVNEALHALENGVKA